MKFHRREEDQELSWFFMPETKHPFTNEAVNSCLSLFKSCKKVELTQSPHALTKKHSFIDLRTNHRRAVFGRPVVWSSWRDNAGPSPNNHYIAGMSERKAWSEVVLFLWRRRTASSRTSTRTSRWSGGRRSPGSWNASSTSAAATENSAANGTTTTSMTASGTRSGPLKRNEPWPHITTSWEIAGLNSHASSPEGTSPVIKVGKWYQEPVLLYFEAGTEADQLLHSQTAQAIQGARGGYSLSNNLGGRSQSQQRQQVVRRWWIEANCHALRLQKRWADWIGCEQYKEVHRTGQKHRQGQAQEIKQENQGATGGLRSEGEGRGRRDCQVEGEREREVEGQVELEDKGKSQREIIRRRDRPWRIKR